MGPLIIASAYRHEITDDQMLHAFRNAFRVIEEDGLTMFIGAGQAGRILEVGINNANLPRSFTP